MGRPGFMGVKGQFSSGNSSDEVSNFRADKISTVKTSKLELCSPG